MTGLSGWLGHTHTNNCCTHNNSSTLTASQHLFTLSLTSTEAAEPSASASIDIDGSFSHFALLHLLSPRATSAEDACSRVPWTTSGSSRILWQLPCIPLLTQLRVS